MLDQAGMEWFQELNRSLTDELDPAAFQARLVKNLALMDRIALQIVARARSEYPELDDSAVRGSLTDPALADADLGEDLLFPQLQAAA
jgi:hypothetical protein